MPALRSTTPPPSGEGLLVDRELRPLLATLFPAAPGGSAASPEQVQPASVDLRLGTVAYRVRAGFSPAGRDVRTRLAELRAAEVALDGDGAVFAPGSVHIVPLAEGLALPSDVRARFNPRSSTGRCDLFTRVLAVGAPRFDEAPAGFHGDLWLEIAPLSFPVRLRAGDRLCQVRLARGRAALTAAELRDELARAPLAAAQPDEEGCLALSLGLDGRDPCAWRARRDVPRALEFGARAAHRPEDYFVPVRAERGALVIHPGEFHVLASRERIAVPPHLAAEMIPVDVGIGELRNNYAGFFDPGFGWRDGAARGTPAVLEVRAHDVPFLVEEGQVFFRLRWLRTAGTPERLYGEGRADAAPESDPDSYNAQDLTLARCFRPSGGGRGVSRVP